ncbi:MAG: L,D-transpeptidase [Pseudonocardia sp.]|nr:L,D-transpeptidase [Pseudonocardia sp.]
MATSAALAAVVSFVLVGVGVGVGTAEEGPAAASTRSAQVEAPRSPAAAPTPQPASTQSAPSQPAPTEPAAGAAAPESEAPATPSAQPAPGSASVADTAGPARVSAPAPSAAAPALVPGTPCTVTAKACADLAGLQAWLIEDGAIRRGPVPIMIGDEIDPTPLGTFQVEWKAEAWTSREYLTQMPYSVFFAAGGIAFHEGNQTTNSAGCVKLVHADAVAWFEYLQVGDEVQIR